MYDAIFFLCVMYAAKEKNHSSLLLLLLFSQVFLYCFITKINYLYVVFQVGVCLCFDCYTKLYLMIEESFHLYCYLIPLLLRARRYAFKRRWFFTQFVWSLCRIADWKGSMNKTRRAAVNALPAISKCFTLITTWRQNGHGGANSHLYASIRWVCVIYVCPLHMPLMNIWSLLMENFVSHSLTEGLTGSIYWSVCCHISFHRHVMGVSDKEPISVAHGISCSWWVETSLVRESAS